MKCFQRIMILQWIFLMLSLPALGNSTDYFTASQSKTYSVSLEDVDCISDQYLPITSQRLLFDLIDSSEEEEEKIHKKIKRKSPQFSANELLAKQVNYTFGSGQYNVKKVLYFSHQYKPAVDRCIFFQVLQI